MRLAATRRRVTFGLALAALLTGCAEEPVAGPIVSSGRRAVETEQPSEVIVNPHARLRQRSDEERQREAQRLGLAEGSAGGGGGGGGGRDPREDDRPADPPTQRELEEYTRELAAEMDEAVDPDDDACRQFADSLSPSAAATGRATDERAAAVDRATRVALERMCASMPIAYRRCMDRAYYRAHQPECEREMARTNRLGQERADTAQRELAALERATAAGERAARRAPPPEPEPDPEEDDEIRSLAD